MKIVISFFLCLWAMSHTSCSQQRMAAGKELATDVIPIKVDPQLRDQIVFLTLKIELRDSISGLYNVSFKGCKVVRGTLKKSEKAVSSGFKPTELYYQLSAEKNGPQIYHPIPNPLRMAYEFATEQQQLEIQTLHTRQGEIFIRFQYIPSVKFLRLYSSTPKTKDLNLIYRAAINF